ncbi:MAG: hypothetical protein PHN98_11710 [Smithellaceae bacterium]|nr:hypothetical protein [Smithellaceae bacterium]
MQNTAAGYRKDSQIAYAGIDFSQYSCGWERYVARICNLVRKAPDGPYRLRTNPANLNKNNDLENLSSDSGTKSGTVAITPLVELLISWASLPDSIQRAIISAIQKIIEGVSNG